MAQRRGLDPGVYCSQMGVSYAALKDANPGCLPFTGINMPPPRPW